MNFLSLLAPGWNDLWLLPRPLLAVVLGLLGALYGSFLNVVIWRLPRGESLWRHSSRCPHCARPVRAWQNIPVLSWLLLRGRCAGCRGPIALRYPLVELSGAFLMALPLWLRPVWVQPATPWMATPWVLFEGAIFGLLLALALIDYDHRLLPDDLTLLLLAAGVLSFVYARPGGPGGQMMGWGLFCGLALPLIMRWLASAALGREALGLGDVKLLAALGALYGPLPLLIILLFASLAGILFWLGFYFWYPAHWRRRRISLGLPAEGSGLSAARRRARGFFIPFGTCIAAAVPPALYFAPLFWRGWLAG